MIDNQVSIKNSTETPAHADAPVSGLDFLHALADVAEYHAREARQAYESGPEASRWYCDALARWARDAYGEEIFATAARGYVDYCLHVAQAKHNYEETGCYDTEALPRIIETVYGNEEVMTPYMWAKVLSYAYWSGMTAHLDLLRKDFLDRLPPTPRVLELACGHGVMGLISLEHRPDAILKGYDISPPAIRLANRLAAASSHAGRARFVVHDFLELDLAEGKSDGVIAAMLAEHLADPSLLFDSVARYLAPDGLAYVSTALESPQRDNVYEFHNESEPVQMAEAAGLRVVHLVSNPTPQPHGSNHLPRSLAMVLAHR